MLLVEHPAGLLPSVKSGHAENLLVGEEYLRSIGAEFYHIDRGGDITFHGPDRSWATRSSTWSASDFRCATTSTRAEGAVIRTVARYGIRAGRIARAPRASGIEGAQPARKICADRCAGVALRDHARLRTQCGNRFALFYPYQPLGFTDRVPRSIEKEIGRPVPMEEVKRRLVEDLCENLNVKIYKP